MFIFTPLIKYHLGVVKINFSRQRMIFSIVQHIKVRHPSASKNIVHLQEFTAYLEPKMCFHLHCSLMKSFTSKSYIYEIFHNIQIIHIYS